MFYNFQGSDAVHENRASIHVGKGSQDDYNDAKIWLEPEIEVARASSSVSQVVNESSYSRPQRRAISDRTRSGSARNRAVHRVLTWDQIRRLVTGTWP